MGLTASVIIPTYNRSHSLARALNSLGKLEFPRNLWEVVVVDNDSNDDTKEIAETARTSLGLNLRYVREDRLSFTVARHAGAAAAQGEFLLYIDDDVTVEKDWMRAIITTFQQDPKVGMAGGPIKPVFEVQPPHWVLKMDRMWLSLFNCGTEEKEVPGVPGPNLCVRKSVLTEVGGFPPDTIGVEAEGKPGTTEKIYIGPGDWGLSQKVRAAGYKICYIPDALVYHHIPPVRLTKRWWHSRFTGEARYLAITQQHERPDKPPKLLFKSVRSLARAGVEVVLWSVAPARRRPPQLSEFRVSFYLSRARTEWVLSRHPHLADRLWEVGLSGVVSDDDKVSFQLLSQT